MRYDLAAIARRAKNQRRSSIPLRDIRPPSTFAGDLYRSAYAPVIANWNAAIPAIMAEYERTIAESTTDSPADIEGKIDEAERSFQLLAITITPRIERWALRVEAWFRGKWRGSVLSATSVDIGQLIGAVDVRKTLESTIAWNVSLVKDVGAEAQRRISAAVYDGLRSNKPAREVAKALREAVDLGRARSVRVASDQLAKVASALADERRREAGLYVWQWLHSGKRHPREDHKARDGKLYSDEAKAVGQVLNGQTLLAPPDDRPGQLPYCGCRSQAILVFE
jgi:uncharacterized protein with gpF-like domain